jgi:hypothetical protein
MIELLAFIGLIVVGVFLLKLFFGVLGLVFHILLFPIKLVLSLVVVLVALPFLILLIPVFLVLGVGMAVVGTAIAALFGFCWAW